MSRSRGRSPFSPPRPFLCHRVDGLVSLTYTFSVFLIDYWNARSFTRRYGVEFPVTEKADVNGPNAHPFFVYLKEKVSPGTR